jgi:hypothetical protein
MSGRGAWIASGPLAPQLLLELFAPRARGKPDPSPATTLTTLIATDLASEGLNLQDADAVVHYDLPWTPLRLEQRVGRVARLGSSYDRVEVWWFAPPESLECELQLARRIAAKTHDQLGLGTPQSSRVGQAVIIGRALAWRERLTRGAKRPALPGPIFSVVRGPRAGVFVLRWRSDEGVIPEIVILEDGQVVSDPDRSAFLIECLLRSKPAPGVTPTDLVSGLERFVRQRLRAAERGAGDQNSVRLSREIARQAGLAVRRREERRLRLLDEALDRVSRGLTEGERLTLEKLLRSPASATDIQYWIASLRPRPDAFTVRLDAALLGTGL